jgi:hypothetical protein
MWFLRKADILNNHKGQSAVELAIFGSILIFVISLIFRQGLSGGNFMRTQLQATRYAMSKSFEMSLTEKPGRNSASVLVIEDRLAGDFGNKFGSRDRVPLIASGSGTYTNQMFYPVDDSDFGDRTVLSRFDVWVNGQRFAFLTSNFNTIDIPNGRGNLALCTENHPTDSRCWDPACGDTGCVMLQRIVQNYPGSGFSSTGNFDVNFNGRADLVAPALRIPIAAHDGHMSFMWQWQPIAAVGELPTNDAIDVDGDFHDEQILSSVVDPVSGRTIAVNVIDRQNGDLDFTLDGRRPNAQVGLLNESQMFSFTQAGTYYEIREGKLYDGQTGQYIRNTNFNQQVDVVQRVIQLTNNTGRFCNGNAPTAGAAWDGDPAINPVAACNNCFSPTNVRLTCFDTNTLRLYVRSQIINRSGRSWFTRTENIP